MIQRIQTLYLLISIICLLVVQFGTTIFYLIGENMYSLNAYGILKSTPGKDQELIKSMPIFLIVVLLIVLLVISIFSYKNLKKQLKLVKFTGVIYAIVILIGVFFIFTNWNFVEGVESIEYKVSTGFYFISMGLPGIFLALQGIKKDKKTLDSLNSNRLR